MDNKTAFKTIKNLGLACADAIENIGFKNVAIDARKDPVSFGLASYLELEMQGMDGQLDRAYDKVVQYIYDEGAA